MYFDFNNLIILGIDIKTCTPYRSERKMKKSKGIININSNTNNSFVHIVNF